MNDNSFKMCIDCANKQSRVNLAKGTYYCPFVKDIKFLFIENREGFGRKFHFQKLKLKQTETETAA